MTSLFSSELVVGEDLTIKGLILVHELFPEESRLDAAQGATRTGLGPQQDFFSEHLTCHALISISSPIRPREAPPFGVGVRRRSSR